MGRLDGKQVLIVGGTTGIGLESARLFADEGARVAVCGRNTKSVSKAGDALGKSHLAIQCNIGNVRQIDVLMKEVGTVFGRLDVLFVNAAIASYQPLEEVTTADFDRMFAVNVRGPFFCVQKARSLLQVGRVVILTGSIASKLGQRNTSLYAASKAPIRSLARTLSAELLAQGVRVLCLTPGPVETPIFQKSGLSEDEAKSALEHFSKTIPIGRHGAPSELAKAALFLASDESSFMLGAELVVDGGKSQL